jgi:hypothetical protein
MKGFTLGFMIALASTSSAMADGGFFACTTNSGTVFTGGLDGEANVQNAVSLQAGSAETTKLEVESLNLFGKLEIELIQSLPEENVVTKIKASKINGSSEAAIESRAGEALVKEKGVCVVKFEAGV